MEVLGVEQLRDTYILQIFTNFSAPFVYGTTSLCLPLQEALREGHVHILLVCTTLVGVLFVATTTYTISVYYVSMRTVCGHYHVYY